MEKDEIVVSIIMPIFNRIHLIGETIQSVLNQSFARWELIVVDDGSTDDVGVVIRDFSDERIRYYPITHSGCLWKVREFGTRQAVGKYISFLDSDDLWLPHKLEFQLSLLSEHPEAGFTFSHGEQFGAEAIPPPSMEKIFVGDIFRAQLIEERFVLYPTSFFFRSEVLRSVGTPDQSISGGDINYFLRIAHQYPGIFSGEKLVKIRKHDQNISLEREFIFSRENLAMYRSFHNEGLISRKDYEMISSKQSYKLGILYLKKNRPGDAIKGFLDYVRLRPLHYKGWGRLAQSFLWRIARFV
jgi:glycosyltransferase involved in cell wall biosynthesis